MAHDSIFLRPTAAEGETIRKAVVASGLSINSFCVAAILKACGEVAKERRKPGRPAAPQPPPLTPEQEKKRKEDEYYRLLRKHMGIRLKGEK